MGLEESDGSLLCMNRVLWIVRNAKYSQIEISEQMEIILSVKTKLSLIGVYKYDIFSFIHY